MKRGFYKIISPLRTAYWFIFRPKTTGAKCLIEHNERFLMIRNGYGSKKWTFPGGGVNKREAPEKAAQREALEEVGIAPETLVPIGEYFNTRQYKRDTVYCFYGKTHNDHFTIDNDEVLEAAWFAMSDIPEIRSRSVDAVLDLYSAHFNNSIEKIT